MVSTSISVASLVASDRSTPEDAVRVVQADAITGFIVADGAGGLGGGARAAHLVVETLEGMMRSVGRATVTPASWCQFLLELDDRLLRDADAGESTAVVAAIRDGLVTGASVGDSEAWLVTRGECQVLTSGQQRLRLGSGRAVPVGFETAVVNDSMIVAATDGLFHAARADAICAVLRTAPTPERLVALARSRSGKLYDDVGIVIVAIV
jgi:serine/threonine protein phosphatase PrpC